jgi:hypothetical protein
MTRKKAVRARRISRIKPILGNHERQALIRLSKALQSNRGEYDVGGSSFLSSTLFALKTAVEVPH